MKSTCSARCGAASKPRRPTAKLCRPPADLARITVVADVVRAYVENCSAAEELAIAQQSLDLQKQRVALTRRLRDAGRGNTPDVTRGQTQVDTLNADIPRYRARRRIAQYRLAMLLARAPSDLPPGVLACHATPRIKNALPVGDGAALLRRRPDVREAERRLAASTARIGVATGALYPTVAIGASAGVTGIAGDLGKPETQRWGFGPLISWTFPVNGARGRVREARAGADVALARFDGVVLNALRETQSSLATYAADYERAGFPARGAEIGGGIGARDAPLLYRRARVVHRRPGRDPHADDRPTRSSRRPKVRSRSIRSTCSSRSAAAGRRRRPASESPAVARK